MMLSVSLRESAVAAYEARKFDEAEYFLTQAIEAAQNEGKLTRKSRLYQNRGIIRISLGQYESARDDFGLALRLDPTYTLAQIGVAEAYFLERNFALALEACEAAKELSRLFDNHLLKDIEKKTMLIRTKYLFMKRGNAPATEDPITNYFTDLRCTNPNFQTNLPDLHSSNNSSYASDEEVPKDPPALLPSGSKYDDIRWRRFDLGRLHAQDIMRGLQIADKYYIIPADWWNQWCESVGGYAPEKDNAAWSRIARDFDLRMATPSNTKVHENFALSKISDYLPPIAEESVEEIITSPSGDMEEETDSFLEHAIRKKGRIAADILPQTSPYHVMNNPNPGPIDTTTIVLSDSPVGSINGDPENSDQSREDEPNPEGAGAIPVVSRIPRAGGSGPEGWDANLYEKSEKSARQNVRLKTNLMFDRDVVALSENMFSMLSNWYGTKGPNVERYVVPCSYPRREKAHEKTIDIYPELHRYDKYMTLNILDDESIDSDDDGANTPITPSPKVATPTIHKCVVCKDPAHSRCRICKVTYYCAVPCQEQDWPSHRKFCKQLAALSNQGKVDEAIIPKYEKLNGLVGLANLGNTCFMNSSLQALSAIWPLTKYFLMGAYKADLNRTNPLGTKGKLADAFADLIRSIWLAPESVRSIAPRELKSAVARFQDRFDGFAQHDAQELLTYILDGLHEDCNRVVNKPLTSDEDQKDRPDTEFAKVCWEIFSKRNRSQIFDVLGGQLRSRLVCPRPQCRRVSVKFDPYNMIQLPIVPSDEVSFWCMPILLKRLVTDYNNPLSFQVPEEQSDPALRTHWDQVRENENHKFHFYASVRWELHTLKVPVGWQSMEINTIAELLSKVSGIKPENLVFIQMARGNNRYGQRFFVPGDIVHRLKADSNVFQLWSDFVDKQDIRNVTETSMLVANEVVPEHWIQPTVGPTAQVEPSTQELALWEKATQTRLSEDIQAYVDQRNPNRRYFVTINVITSPNLTNEIDSIDNPMDLPVAAVAKDQMQGVREGCLTTMILPVTKSMTVGVFRMLLAREIYYLIGQSYTRFWHIKHANGTDMAFKKYSSDAVFHSILRYVASILPVTFGGYENNDFYGEYQPELAQWLPTFDASGTDVDNAKNMNANSIKLGDILAFNTLENDERFHLDVNFTRCWVYLRGKELRHHISMQSAANDIPMQSVGVLGEELRQPKPVNLVDCFVQLSRPEKLDRMNMWRCDSCKEEVQAEKQILPWSFPNFLILHLMRFKQRNSYLREKMTALVNFPLRGLNLAPFNLEAQKIQEEAIERGETPPDTPSAIYDCCAVVNHFGDMYGGHYTAFANHHVGKEGASEHPGQWYHFDDTHVSKVGDENTVVSKSAYILVYRRRQAGDPGFNVQST